MEGEGEPDEVVGLGVETNACIRGRGGGDNIIQFQEAINVLCGFLRGKEKSIFQRAKFVSSFNRCANRIYYVLRDRVSAKLTNYPN